MLTKGFVACTSKRDRPSMISIAEIFSGRISVRISSDGLSDDEGKHTSVVAIV